MEAVADRERAVLVLGVLAASVYLGLSAGHRGLGDYPLDAGPAMTALLRGNIHGFLIARPAMGVLSLLVRAPFSALAYLGSASQAWFYRLGAIPCVASLGLFAVWMAGIARSRGAGLLAQVVIVAVALVNPFVSSALSFGHPEELLTASLALGAVVAAAQDRVVLTTVLLGVALATKQWAILALFPVVACLDRRRVRVLCGSVVLAAMLTLPAVLANASSWLHAQFSLAHAGSGTVPVADSWPFLIASHETLHFPGGLIFSGPHLSAGLAGLLHPLTIALAIVFAVWLAIRADRRAVTRRLFAAVALIFLLRCTLDPGNQPYYGLPLLATLLAWDALASNGLPVRALLAAAAAYIVFDRLPSSFTPAIAGDIYCAATLTAALGLLWLLADLRVPGLGRIAARASGRRVPVLPPVDGDVPG